MTARDKDRILAEIMAYKPHYEIKGLNEVLPELESEGLVMVWRSEQRNPIMVRLTDKGQALVDGRGYEAQKKQRFKATAMKVAKWVLVTLAGAALVELATVLVRHWLSQ